MKKGAWFQQLPMTLQFPTALFFSDKSDWVMLVCADYEPGAKTVNEEAEGIAKKPKTHCVAVGVVDSDMLTLDLFGSTAKQSDSIATGRTLWDESETKDMLGSDGDGTPEKWEPLFTEGRTWDEFKKIFSKNPTFIEETLVEIAPVLGMDIENIASDFDCFEHDGSQVFELHLKSKDAKKLSLNTAFIKVFSEGPAPLGFVKLKKSSILISCG